MNVRRFTILAAFLMALVVFSGGVVPQQQHAEASEIRTPLRFGQTIALSDFDADGVIDEAMIEGPGLRKSVGIRLSGSGKRSVLHFNASRTDYGSLLAQDVDNDGATDLVWTDLLHSDDVIVWLGDGTGQFERTSEKPYCDRFTLGASSVDAPHSCGRETAISPSPYRPLDLSIVDKSGLHPALELPGPRFDGPVALSPPLGQPPGRSPPLFLS